ncbi:MAG: efflux RND transporter periplasmic adaptor subunit [Verrucomicrobiota bacterium JB022]|nr:efflux RND transporter periplasmic adaptor subunit [Verrucomicrobiota bacterium JB022]
MAFAGVAIWLAGCGQQATTEAPQRRPAPVEVFTVEKGTITERRDLSGTLRASADFVVASKVSGRVDQLKVRVSDTIERRGIVAVLEDESYVQEVRRAEADLLVAEANLEEAKARAEIAQREMQRVSQLRERGVSSDTQYDTALGSERSARAGLAVAQAQVARAEAALETAHLQLGYTEVRAEWSEGDATRIVAERFVDEGDMVAVNDEMFRIVNLDPLLGVVNVTERDYPRVSNGNTVTIRTDAYAGQTFEGKVVRVAPVFSENSRQAMVEFEVPNADGRLKPGMFVRAELVMQDHEDTIIIPEAAVVRRDNTNGVFLVDEGGKTVSWQPVRLGIREGDRVEVTSGNVSGQVVTLGQQLLEDGSAITIDAD